MWSLIGWSSVPVPRSGAGDRGIPARSSAGTGTSLSTRKASKGLPAMRCRSAICRGSDVSDLVQDHRAHSRWKKITRPTGG
jgi:hypothetical protein